jgi:hypothetical protein
MLATTTIAFFEGDVAAATEGVKLHFCRFHYFYLSRYNSSVPKKGHVFATERAMKIREAEKQQGTFSLDN